jgi:hypothetical protein
VPRDTAGYWSQSAVMHCEAAHTTTIVFRDRRSVNDENGLYDLKCP